MKPIALRQFGDHARRQSTLARRNRARRAGLTLIEVAIAMVVFVIGALAIIQIFPPLLGAIQNSESRTVAARLADSTLSRLNDDPKLVPDAIYNAVYDSGKDKYELSSTGSSVTGTASLNQSLPDTAQGFNSSALSQFKRIVGERHTVLRGATGTPDFVLTQFPYEEGTLKVYLEDEIKGVRIGSDGKLDFSDAKRPNGQSFNDTGNGFPNRPPNGARGGYTYYVSYRWISSGALKGVLDEPIKFLDNGIWDGDTTGRVTAGLIDTSINPGPVLSGAVTVRYRAEQTITTPSPEQAQRGYLPLSGIPAGTTASLDYTVIDWRWLVDERVLNQQPDPDTDASFTSSFTSPRYVRLPVRNIEDEGGVQAYGLVWSRIAGTSNYTIQPPSATTMKADAPNGLMYYDAEDLSAPRARTVYQTVDNWTQQLSVAARSYIPYLPDSAFVGARPATAPREQWREYSTTIKDSKNNLCFHSGEAGKTVAVSYMSGTSIVNNKVLTISPEVQPGGVYSLGTDFPYVAVAGIPSNATILSVRGLDIRTRVAWINGGRWTQTVLTGYRAQ